VESVISLSKVTWRYIRHALHWVSSCFVATRRRESMMCVSCCLCGVISQGFSSLRVKLCWCRKFRSDVIHGEKI
jgi:hypothetical protein